MFPNIYVHQMSNNSSAFGFILDPFIMCDQRHVWTFFTMLFCVSGIIAYTIMLCELHMTHRNGTPVTPNVFFTLNLSVMDIAFLVFIPPGIINSYTSKSLVFENLWNAIFALSLCGRPLLMACICMDCYLAVVHPLIYRKWKSLTPRILVAAAVWMFTLTSGILYFHLFSLFFTVFTVIPYIVTIIIIMICDSFILYTLIRSGPGGNNIHPQKQRAVQTLINSLVIAVISYVPPVLLFAVGKLLVSDIVEFQCNIAMQMTISSTMGSAVMPLLYLHNLGKLNCFRLKSCSKF